MLPTQHLTLKKFEQFKAAMRPYDYFEMLDTLDFESLGEGDRFYLQCFGIYNSELEEETFMLRIRTAGGRIKAEHFTSIAAIVKEHDLQMVLTALEPDNVLEVFKEVNGMDGLTTWQTFGDNIRNVVTDPYDGVGRSCKIEAYPLIERMQSFFLRNPELVGMLPRRVSVGITGMVYNAVPLFSNDLLFALAKRGEELAMPADIFLAPDDAVDFFEALIFAFNRYGSREKRTRSRLFHMIEDIGMEGLKEKIGEFYKKPWPEAGELLQKKRDFGDFEELKDGTFGYRYRTDYGVVGPEEFETIAQFVSEKGAEVRLGIDQQIYILGLESPPLLLLEHQR